MQKVCTSRRRIVGELVLRGTRIVLPNTFRSQAISLAHEGHLGIVDTKQNLRRKVWWLRMEKAAEKFCKSCHGCQLVSRSDPPEPLRSTTLPEGPWHDLAIDLLGPLPSGHSILVVVDYYSRYYQYTIMTSTVTEKVIDNLEEIFSRYGLPLAIKSDNGPQFCSEEFREYCKQNGIVHIKTTPKWPQANEEVERQNASLMKRIRIAQAEGLDWVKELRRYVTKYRGIDHTTTSKSPAKLLFNRKMRGKLPELHADYHLDLEIRDKDAEVKAKTKAYADKFTNAKPSDVQVGDQVLLNGTNLFHFVHGHQSWADYLTYMEQDGAWGDHVILCAATNCYETCIRVVSSLNAAHDVILRPQCPVDKSSTLVLGHIHEVHYVSLHSTQGIILDITPSK
ncbi:uncharacterized protein K02A2.6-like [Stylophora pistillata]|uniref:uncharacterized protein K02A2.6-like n=1 Tax=Stylophora pistillata TaxID=50429 RepID=UPI000C05163D|nr:uncharacterized protein K02A2.6-like [Stylophora pistillata]